jgi:hypothetical protein
MVPNTCLLLTAGLLFGIPSGGRAQQAQPDRPFTLTVSNRGLVSLRARAVPASRILAALRERHGIAVDVAEFRDTTVTVAVREVSLDSALVLILPANARVGTVVVRDERVLPARTGDKPGRRVAKESGLPRKGGARRPPPTDRPRKASVRDTSVRRPAPDARLKDAPSANVPPTTGREKQAIPRAPQGDSVVWMSLTIQNGVITVDAARLIEGPRIVSTVPQGSYVYVFYAGGRPIAVESFYDPFEQRAYAPQPQDPHRAQRTQIGQFVATVPLEALRGVTAQQLSLRVFTVRPGARLTQVDVTAVSDTTRTLVPVAAASGETLSRALAPLMR